jgi:methylthioribose-1-phosphate isomerase
VTSPREAERVAAVRPGELAAFRAVGGHLARRGLIAGTEGNISISDGQRLVVTRTGCELASLERDDLLAGTLSDPPEGASSDTPIHLITYRNSGQPDGVRAIVHAHPAAAMPRAGDPRPRHGRHGVYGTGRTLEQAAAMVEMALRSTSPPPLVGTIAGPFAAVRLSLGAPAAPEDDAPEIPPRVHGFDQTRMPRDDAGFEAHTVEEVAEAIRRLAVRGAPLLGITAAFGTTLAAFRARLRGEDVREAVEKAGALLVATRPTAVNIRSAVERLERIAAATPDAALPEALHAEARDMELEDAEACSAMGWHGASLIPQGANVLTHCNTGMLCTAGIGTALGVLWCAHLAGKGIHLWVDETRPLLQGARLTAWELDRLGVPFTVVADAAAGSLMARGMVDAVITGADRIAANGDVANKIGTYPLAVLAARHGIPFYVAAPSSTVDLRTATGADIRIEERDPEEVTHAFGRRVTPEGVAALNPAFDVTPAELVTAVVTERGVLRPPYPAALGGAAVRMAALDQPPPGGARNGRPSLGEPSFGEDG